MTSAKQILKEVIRIPAESLLKVHFASLPSARFDSERINRILVFAYHGLGNFIMYTPALKLLRQRYPKARIDLQVGNNTGCEEVLAGAGLFDNIYNLRYSAGLGAWLERAQAIRATRYDLTINEFHSHSWPLALLVAASGAPFRLGHVTSPGWSERFSRYSFIFNIPVTMREDEHEVERYLDLVAAVGATGIDINEARPFIHLEAEDREFANGFLGETGLFGSSKVIGVQPGTSATMRWKQWPAERFRLVIERLLADHTDSQIILFGSANEASMIEDLARGLGPRARVAAGKTTVKQVAALIERCDLLVSNDSGLMHVAVAVGTPVAAIYGPTDLNRTAPLGPGHRVIRHNLPCSPCFKLESDAQVQACSHHDCLMTITPDEVYQVINETLPTLANPASLAGEENRPLSRRTHRTR